MSGEGGDTLATRHADAMAGVRLRDLGGEPGGKRGLVLARAGAALRAVVSHHDGLMARRASAESELERERRLGMRVAAALERLERCGRDSGDDEIAAMRDEVERALAAWEALRSGASR